MTIHFPDLSHFKTVSLTGALALITKATQGLSFVDSTYASYKRDAAARGIPFAGYHWVDGSDLAGQAAHAHAIMGDTPCMWDAEANGATVPRLVELTQRYRALGGNPRLVYLPHWWWQDHLGSPDLRPLAALGLALVSSAYPASGYSETGVGWRPYGGMTPAIWQWSDAHLFNGARVDFNAFRGTVGELRALLTGQPQSQVDGSEITMFTTQIAGNPACWLSDGFKYRPIIDGNELHGLASAGARHVVVPNAAELAKLCGKPVTDEPEHVTLTPEAMAAIAALLPMGGSGVVDLAKLADAVVGEIRDRLAE
jgi:hypothetical protein